MPLLGIEPRTFRSRVVTRRMHYHYAKEAKHPRWGSNPRFSADVHRITYGRRQTRYPLRYEGIGEEDV